MDTEQQQQQQQAMEVDTVTVTSTPMTPVHTTKDKEKDQQSPTKRERREEEGRSTTAAILKKVEDGVQLLERLRDLTRPTPILLDTDSYKVSHWKQYPPGTTTVFSYIESRGGVFPKVISFGIKAILQQLCIPITAVEVLEANEFWTAHGEPFNLEGWHHIVRDHGGLLPLRIRGVPEGTVVPTKTAMLTVENTCPKCFWCTSWVETMLMRVWYPTTVATLSGHIKRKIKKSLEETADGTSGLDFKLHDFGSRGVSSQESAALGGMAHLVNFMGTDTAVALMAAKRLYDETMAGFSIPAAEHSTITAWGKDGEVDAYRNMVKQFSKPGSIYACVSDSYDLMHACEKIWGEDLKEAVEKSGGKLVIRPDSGDPTVILPQMLDILEKKFGSTTNTKGYKMLPPYLGIIWGDGINDDSIEAILEAVKKAGWSTDNLAFGMGGALLQHPHRDTQKFAMKASWAMVNGKGREVFKDPVTDPGKASKKGRLDTIKDPETGELRTVVLPDNMDTHPNTCMVELWCDGQMSKELKERTWQEIRASAAELLNE